MTKITIITREGALECMDNWLWGLWHEDKFIPLSEILEPHIGKYIKLEITALEATKC